MVLNESNAFTKSARSYLFRSVPGTPFFFSVESASAASKHVWW